MAQINALAAYDEGATGDGVIVAIIDSGIDVPNGEFAGRIHPQSADLVAQLVNSGDITDPGVRTVESLQDEDDHGTPIASIIGAARDNVGVHGVAPEAQLLILRGDDDSTDDPIIFGEAISEGIDRAGSIGAGVLNLSLGSTEASARPQFTNLFTRTAADDIVAVVAAGNESDASGGTIAADPDPSALGALDVVGAPTTIIAGAVDENNQIANFTNRAGVAADIYLVAPGVRVPVTFIGANAGQTALFSGTSASTPHIAGAAALLRDLWPTLTASEIVEILLDTATDLGAVGTDPIFGRGLLNLEAAVQPVGATTTSSINGAVTSVSASTAQLSPIFGAGFAGLGDIIVLDQYNRDFRLNLGDTVRGAAPDLFNLEGTFSPYYDQAYANQRINGRLTAHMRLTSEDNSFTELNANLAASFDGAQARHDVTERRLSLALTSDLGAGRALTVAQGFRPQTAERLRLQSRQNPFLSEAAFADRFLPDTPSAVTSIFETPLSKNLQADFLVSYAYDYSDNTLALTSSQQARRGATMRAGLNYYTDNLHLRFEQGVRQEEGAVLDALFLGANSSALTVYGAVEADWAMSAKWRLKARYAAGYTSAQTDGFNSFIDEFSNLTTTQFSVALARKGFLAEKNDLWLGVSQPLQIETGAARLTLPTGFDKQREILSFEEIAVPLGVEGRRLDFEAGYRVHTGRLGVFDLNLLHQTFGAQDVPAATTFLLRSGFTF